MPFMNCIIAGSRSITDPALVFRLIDQTWFAEQISTVFSGGARGVDSIGERWAQKNGKNVLVYQADWDRHGRSAGINRNIEMAKGASALIAVWDGQSRGTRHMIDTMKRKLGAVLSENHSMAKVYRTSNGAVIVGS